MKRLFVSIALLLALGFAGVPSGADAAGAYFTSFTVSITYMNISSSPAAIQVSFYPENDGTPINFSPANLPGNASASLAVSSVSSVTSGFKGSAVMSSDQPILATVVQIDPTGGVKNRPLSNGFTSGSSTGKMLVPTVLKEAFDYTTVFSVQNTESVGIDLTVDFYAVGETAAAATLEVTNLPKGAAKFFDAGTIADLASGFNGSAIVTAVRTGTTTPAGIAITANELQIGGAGSSSFEGTPDGAAKVFMPSALCEYPVSGGSVTTRYAVQNASATDSVTFKATFKVAGSADTSSEEFTLQPGGKKSLSACESDGGFPAGTTVGSAVLERTAGNGTLVAVGKAQGGGVTSAFLGAAAGSGSNQIALPYVRWSPDSTYFAGSRQRAAIAIQNIGTADATNVVVDYLDKDGNVVNSESLGTISPGLKKNSSAASAGALDSFGRFGEYGPEELGTSFGGGAIVRADTGAELAVIVRIQSIGVGEDYNGINIAAP